MDLYDLIAEYYEPLQKDVDAGYWAGLIHELAEKYCLSKGEGKDGRRILTDLGCGTGSITSCLRGRYGYETIGVDRSENMLNIARERDSQVLWLCQDIRQYELFGASDIFIATLDTVNHLTDGDDIKRLFRSFLNYMPPGGVFIFDAVTSVHLSETLGNNIFFQDEEDYTLLWENTYEDGMSRSDITLFYSEDGENYKRADATVRERFYSEDFLVSCATEGETELVHKQRSDDNERDIYVFRKLPGEYKDG